jgi:hypothetical protein
MPEGGEMQVWRDGVRAEALTGVGRFEEALAVAEAGVEVAREYRLGWSLPLVLRALAKARAAAGRDGVAEALEEAEAAARAAGSEMAVISIEHERDALTAAG